MNASKRNIQEYSLFSVKHMYVTLPNNHRPLELQHCIAINFQLVDQITDGARFRLPWPCSFDREFRRFNIELQHILGQNSTTSVSNMLYQLGILSCHPQALTQLTQEIKNSVRHMPRWSRTNCRFQIFVRMIRIVSVDTFTDELLFQYKRRLRVPVQTLKKTRVTKSGIVEDPTCAICLEDVSVESEAILLPCSHSYHIDCIFRWLEKGRLCPMCRSVYSFIFFFGN